MNKKEKKKGKIERTAKFKSSISGSIIWNASQRGLEACCQSYNIYHICHNLSIIYDNYHKRIDIFQNRFDILENGRLLVCRALSLRHD